jgi:hypothetical protein
VRSSATTEVSQRFRNFVLGTMGILTSTQVLCHVATPRGICVFFDASQMVVGGSSTRGSLFSRLSQRGARFTNRNERRELISLAGQSLTFCQPVTKGSPLYDYHLCFGEWAMFL